MASGPRDSGGRLAGRVGVGLAVGAGVWLLFVRFNASPGKLSGEALRMTLQGDLLAYYLPMTQLAAERLRALELPLWNPHVCSGIPLLATLQVGVFHPASWLAVVLPADVAISVRMAAECVAAGWLAAAMFRALGHSAVACACGGVLYVFACVLGQVLWPPTVSTLTLVPALVLCVWKLLSAPLEAPPPAGWWLALAATVALQLLAGFPQYTVYGYAVVLPLAGLRLFELRGQGARGVPLLRRAVWTAAAVALGVGLAGVQLAPSLELVSLGRRVAALTPTETHYLTIFDPYRLPDVVRAAFDPDPGWIALNLGNRGGYLGVATLLLALLAVALRPRAARTLLWLVLGATSLLLADGLYGVAAPLYRLFAEIPVIGSFRTPERLRVVGFLCVIALAVSGLDAVREAGDGRRLRVSLAVATAGIGLGLVWTGHGAGAWRLAAAAALVFALARGRIRTFAVRRAAGTLLFVLIVLDLALATGEYGALRDLPVERSNRYWTASWRRALPPGFFERERDALGTGRLELYRYRPRMATAPSDGGFRVGCYEPLVPGTWVAFERVLTGRNGMGATLFDLDPDEHALFRDLSGVRSVLVDAPDGPVWRPNDDALPRAYLAFDHRRADQTGAFEAIRDGGVDPRQLALVEEDPGFPGQPGRPIEPARVIAYAAERVEIETAADRRALLVLTDSFYPGWQARVDGEEAPILRVFGLYRGVTVPAGRHRVVFDYAPESLRLGAILTGLAGAVLLATAAWLRARSRRRESEGH